MSSPSTLIEETGVVSDLGPLAWVLDELRKSLDGAAKAVRRFVRDAELARGSELTDLDTSHLRVARQQLHQAVGALEMVGMESAAKLTRAMESVAQRFVQRPESCSEEAANCVEKASFAIVEYLEGVLKGKQASPVALFPQYRAVMELVGAERIHPADLWATPWRWLAVELPVTVAPLYYSTELRARLDQMVLKVVKTTDRKAAQRLATISASLSRGETTLESRSFWAVAAGFFEAVEQNLVPDDVYSKRTASRILQQYALLAKGESKPSERLAQDLVFFCSLGGASGSGSAPLLSAVRTAFGLTNALTVNYQTEQFGRFDPAQLVLARKRIASAAETWSALAGGDTNRLKVVAEQFAAVGESILKLHPESSSLAEALAAALEATVRAAEPPKTGIAMEVATAILYLEAAYDDLDPTDDHMRERGARLATRLEQVCAGEEPEPLESWMEDLYRRVSDRQTMGSVVDELRASLLEVEKALDQFFRNPKDKAPLREVPSRLAQMRGVFSVLGLDQPSIAALRMRSSVDQFLIDEIGLDSSPTAVFEKLGNSLGAMGLLIDMLSYQRAMAKQLFIYDEEMGELRPMMGRQRTATVTDVAVEVPFASREAVVDETASSVQPRVGGTEAGARVQSDVEDDDDDMQSIFLEEAREVIERGLQAIRALASDPSNLADQTTIRRAFHTLKGSSRMVGLNDFGEAAWSFEQLFNAWLAEQKPASDELIILSGQAMQCLGLWAADIASERMPLWDSALFRKSSDAMRLANVFLPLLAKGDQQDVEEVVPFEMPALDFPNTQLADSLESVALTTLESKVDFESTQLANTLDFGDRDVHPEFVATQWTGAQIESEPLSDVENTPTAQFDATQAFMASAASEPEVVPAHLVNPLDERDSDGAILSTSDYDFGLPASNEINELQDAADSLSELDFSIEVPAELAEVPLPAANSVAFADEEPEDDGQSPEQLKVIGDLRLSIPFYNVYLNEADEWSRRLQTELGEWALELHRPIPDSTVALAHSLLGSSATVGFSALSNVARTLEQALEHVKLHAQGTAVHAEVFNSAAEEIRRLLHQFAAGFLKDANEAVLMKLKGIIETEFLVPTAGAVESLQEEPEESERGTVILNPEGVSTAAALQNASELETELVCTPPTVNENIAVAAPLKIASFSDDDLDVEDHLDPDLFPVFQDEAVELLPNLGTALRQWAARPDNAGARGESLRVLHTLKGSARLAGAMRLGELAHRMESSIEALGSEGLQSLQVEPLLTRFDALQITFDALGTTVVSADAGQGVTSEYSVSTPDITSTATRIKIAASSAVVAPLRSLSNQSVRVRSQLLDRLVNQAGEVMISRSRMESRVATLRSSLGDLSGNLDRLRQQLRDVELQAESQMQSRLAQTKDTSQAFDPLEFDRFTRVQELTRMMAESVNDVATVQRNLQRTVEGAEDDLISQGRQARELQRDLLRTRMVEFESISDRLYGVVRQAAKEAGKQVKLDIIGGSIEMDRGVLDRMAPAFEHLLRNAVAHGVEDATERKALGKPAAGTITITLHQESNDVSVSFSDDGGGLRADRIRARAIENDLVAEGDALSEEELANLVFAPGFSTARQVTELSGRGIGLDVVLSEVNALGGRIETTSHAGQGSTFKLVLPLTTAVTQVVILRMGELTIGVPSNLMETVLRVPAATLDAAYARDIFEVGDQEVPFFWAGALLQVSGRSQDSAAKHYPVAVFRSAGQKLALHVDEVLGNREVVVKNLGPQLARLAGLAGMSVLASGSVVLIYNPVALATVYGESARTLQALAQSDLASAATKEGSLGAGLQARVAAATDRLPLVLVVDDSITVRRVTQRLLKREGFRVALANDGLQALEKLQEEKPAVVLSDIEMPRMDGFDLVRNIRADASLAHLPVIMITSRIAQKHRAHAAELGVNHYLGKPYSEEELLGLIREYCAVPVEI